MKFPHLILRRTFSSLPPIFEPPFMAEHSAQLTSILTKSPLFEPELDRIATTVSPEAVSSLVINPPNLKLGIRFFIWAIKFRSFKAWKLSDSLFSMVLNQNNKNNDDLFSVYWEVLEEMKKDGLKIPVYAFTALISGYYKFGDPEKAIDSFGKMKDFDVTPNVFTYNAVLYVLVQKNVMLLALDLYNQMLKLNCNPNVRTYTILIDGLCKSGNVEGALVLFDEMMQRGISPNTITYSVVLLGLCQANRDYDAKLLLDKMIDSGVGLDSITCDGMLAGFCKLGKVDEAFLLLKFFENQGYVLGLHGYSCLIDGLFRVGQFEEANVWFGKLVEDGIMPDVVLYTIMIRGYCEAGRVKDAWKWVKEMTENGVAPDTQCYNMLIKGFCNAGLLEEGLSLKLEISKNGCFPDTHTYTHLICGMCRNGLVEDAEQIFVEMEKLGCYPSVVTFNALIDGLCKAGKLEEARLMFHKMEVGRNPSVFLRLTQGANRVMDKASLQTVISRLCESGLYLKAYRLVTKLADAGVSPDIATYNILINSMSMSGNLDAAFKLFRELQLKGQSPDSVTYGTLINGLYRADREEEAMGMVKDMVKKGLSPSSSVYKTLMTWSCRRNEVSMSFSMWVDHLKRVKDYDVDVIKLIEEHFEKGEVEAAVRELLKMDLKLKHIDLGPYTIWLIGLCQARRVNEALAIFNLLLEFDVTVPPPSCMKLIKALRSERKLDLAADVLFYALERGYMLAPRICNQLLSSMLCSQALLSRAISLISKMETLGYDLDACLSQRTKALRQHLSTIQELETAVRLVC